MSDYAIGDVQGCFSALQRLLTKINFDEHSDRLWFVGDLVNRGPESLAVLRFIRQLPLTPRITLGNHDLHLLNLIFNENAWTNPDDTLHEVLHAEDAKEIGHWLRKQSLLYHDPELNIVMCHAGIHPAWSLSSACAYAKELESILSGPDYHHYLTTMYGNLPNQWSDTLTGEARLRFICNAFTRMRFCDAQGRLSLNYKGNIEQAPAHLYPWYALPSRTNISADIVFGHWAALQGQCPNPRIHAIDTGCLWGGALTALCLQDMQRVSTQ